MTDEQMAYLKEQAAWIVRNGILYSSALNQCRVRGLLAGWSDRDILTVHDHLFETRYLELPFAEEENYL